MLTPSAEISAALTDIGILFSNILTLLPQDGLGKTAVHKLQTENMYFVHRKIAETEKDNSAVEGAHKTEQRAEDI